MRLTYRPRQNTLRLTLDQEREPVHDDLTLPGVIDVGEGGRLVGVEVHDDETVDLGQVFEPWLVDSVASEFVSVRAGSAYILLSLAEETTPGEQIRSTEVALQAELDATVRLVALSIPRRVHGFEISYPSGNR